MRATSHFEAIYDHWLSTSKVDESPKRGIVYHYTDAAGLKGILEGGVIYATDYRFLNDKSELSHGLSASTELCERLGRGTSDKHLAKFLENIERYLELPSDNRSFVASFSEKQDDLSQWRGYSRDGEGFTVGLDARALLAKSNDSPETYGFAKVGYSRAEFDTEISKIIQTYYKSIPKDASDDAVGEAAAWCDASIETICAFYKHSSFLSEREWRIIDHVYETEDPSPIKVRARGNGLVPYIEINLKGDDGLIPLASVGVGPTFANPATSQVVRDLCKSHGYDPLIYNAKTPYQRV